MRIPDALDPTPCRDDINFIRTDGASHLQARPICLGSQRLNVPPCPFIDWCRTEAHATKETHGALAGTWAGQLFGAKESTEKRLAKLRNEITAPLLDAS